MNWHISKTLQFMKQACFVKIALELIKAKVPAVSLKHFVNNQGKFINLESMPRLNSAFSLYYSLPL
jgi:hypothetical protein